MIDRDTETSLRYLREVIRSGKTEIIPSSAQAVLNSLANSKCCRDPGLQDALINLLKFVDHHVDVQSTSKLDQPEGMRLVDELQKELLSSRSRPQPEESISSYEVEEPDEGIGSTVSNASTGPDPGLDELLTQLNLRQVAKFEPKFPEMNGESEEEDGGVLTEERKEERAEKHGQKTCEEEVETLPDGTEVRRKKTRTVNMSQSSRQVTISTRGGGVPCVSRRFIDGNHSMNDDTDFETTDFFTSPLSSFRMKRDRANFLNPEQSIGFESTSSEPGQSQKTKTVEATSEVTQSVAQKTQKNGRVLAENAAHKIDTTELNARQIDTFKGKQLTDRKGDGTYEEATIFRGDVPTKKDPNADEFLRGTTLATYVRLNDSLRLHEEQFRKKLTLRILIVW
ncbi:unnamed protein product, partial [Mesorhabditis belari]|uniref:Uncharacterized protein n=1 Tax=Mesorhabditis belari TaxID=2138241 RepID=A0AAF3FQX4_9BILA